MLCYLWFAFMSANPPPFTRTTPCDLCGSSDFALLAERDRRGQALPTVICRVCGLVVHAEIPSDDELEAYYRRQYRLDYHGEYIPSAHRVVREWRRGRRLVRLLKPLLGHDDEVWEIGCGIGCTVSNFQCAGFRAKGIEPGDGFRRFAVEKLEVDARGGRLADLPHQPLCDVVLLVHVLEHLPSPSQALMHVRALLRGGGKCYLEVPNAGAPHAAPGKIFHFAHLYNFTPDTLGMLAAKAGFRVQRWLSAEHDKNLRVLLAAQNRTGWHVDPESYGRAVRAITGSGWLHYHLRWAYIRERLPTLCGHRLDHILARRRMEKILRASRAARWKLEVDRAA